MFSRVFLGSLCLPLALGSLRAQATSAGSGAVRGTVLDPSGAAVRGAQVELQNPVSHYVRTTQTNDQGLFSFDNVPYNNYHLSATAAGFQGVNRDIDVRTPLPVQADLTLALGPTNQSVTVTGGADLVETNTQTHTDIDRDVFEKLPIGNSTSQLSRIVTLGSPGVAADANGMLHGLGDHAQNTFSIDGQPISDQQSKIFSNELPTEAVQSLEVIQGAPPAEYGDKTSLVVVVTTRSGLGVQPAHGDVSASYGTFGTSGQTFDLSYGTQDVGNFLSLSGIQTGRFLDTPEFQLFHGHGNEQGGFDRLDFHSSDVDSVNLNLDFTRSWFQTPNSYDAQNATAWSGPVCLAGGYSQLCNGAGPNGQIVGTQDQRSRIRTFNIAPTWTRIIDPHSILTTTAFLREDQFNYYPSRDPFADFTPNLQTASVGQNRSLKNAGIRSIYTWVNKAHNIKAGATYQQWFLTEHDSFGLVDPTANPPCLNPDGSANTNPLITSASPCPGPLVPNPAFIPLLECYDLTRTAPLPESYGCPAPVSTYYRFYGHANVKLLSLFIQDAFTVRNWSFNLGLRFDKYNGLSAAWQVEPRLAVAYSIKRTNTVLRVSYARTLETPYNENLVIASEGCNYAPIAAFQTLVPGGSCVTNAPLGPGFRNEFHVAMTQAFGKYLVFDGEYMWKYTHNAFDFSVLGNTPITFPIEWQRSKIPGFAFRTTMPRNHGFSAFVVMSSVSARFFGPQVAGIGATPAGSNQVFRIDHDERFNQTSHVQYQRGKNGPWLSFLWRYNNGLVAGAVPCAGGACANGPGGSDTVVSVLDLTPNQQFQAGLFCGPTFATPLKPISPTGLCPASEYGSRYLSIPAPGTANNDHNPPRVSPRNLFDIGIGDDKLFGDKHRWSAELNVVNLTNKVALYNFLSTFSGTHYVSPRAITATIGFHF